MARLALPISSPVPLDVLSGRIDTLLDRACGGGGWGSAITTRFEGVCRSHGIETVWMLATYRNSRFGKFKNAGPGTVVLGEDMLGQLRCMFDAFPQLRGVLENVAMGIDSQQRRIDFPEVLMALAGIGDWAKDETIIAALAEYGLRPAMPLEELFVYVPVVTEPKKLTVSEELLAFGALQAVDVLPAVSMEDLPSGVTMIEVMMILAASEDWFGWGSIARDRFKKAARERLSPEAQKKIGIVEE